MTLELPEMGKDWVDAALQRSLAGAGAGSLSALRTSNYRFLACLRWIRREGIWSSALLRRDRPSIALNRQVFGCRVKCNDEN